MFTQAHSPDELTRRRACQLAECCSGVLVSTPTQNPDEIQLTERLEWGLHVHTCAES